MRVSGRWAALTLGWTLGLLLALPAAAETWYEAYEKAERALAAEKWSEAVAHLNTALELKANSGANERTYGMRFVDYFPYLRLGIAYYQLGQTAAALAAFETEERQGALTRSARSAAELEDYRGRIERRRAQDEASRQARAQAILGDNLEQARRLEREGRIDEALLALSRVLALAPDHAEAGEARRRLLAQLGERQRAEERRAQSQAARPELPPVAPDPRPQSDERPPTAPSPSSATDPPATASPEPAHAALLAEAERRFAAGELEPALAAANRVLAVDGANRAALRLLSQAYARLSASLLSSDETPPVILLDGDAPTGATVAVDSPELVLTGTVYDDTEVTISIVEGGRTLPPPTLTSRELQGVWITGFRWQFRLPAGLTRLKVVAVDQAGNRSELDYAAEYDVPFVRSLGFPLALASGALSLLAGWWLMRWRRRRKLFQGRFNPYVAGSPIFDPARFFGRQQLVDYVLRRISNNSIMLYGERRIGKTSLQHQLKRRLATLDDPDHEFYPVFIDLQGTPQEKFFSSLAGEVFHELSPKLGGMKPPAALGEDAYGYSEFVQDIQRVLAALRAKTAKKVKLVLLIDEVDELNHYDPRINQRLRSLFMRAFADNLVSVVSGVGIKKQWEREGSPWYNFFQEVEVKPFDPAEARALIEAPVAGMFRFEAGVPEEIIRRTQAKPYLIQRLCSGLVDRMHQEGRREITHADLEVAFQVERL